ncbi:MAG TPA: FHA domain-containing protein [Verrucomicrobiae bacterium]|nr:FHA domain-containing protein [Verrucomicrobiae bacterium]
MPSLIHKRPDGSDKTLEFGSKPIIVGRVPEAEILVRDSFVSRVHCGFGHVNNQFTLKDLGSTNGTYRNGARVFECNLVTGDKIQVGNTTLMFEIDTATGNGIIRQIPQMVAPPRTLGQPAPPKPGEMGVTVQVKLPGQNPPSSSGPPAG